MRDLGTERQWFKDHDIHLHIPAGGIPKDGPSAGVTMATTLVSLLTGRRIQPLIAMTGEITLSGNVLPVGGIKEKVLAAKRAGVRDVILPAENKMNVEEDLTPEQLENLRVHYVKTIDEALHVSLPQVAEGPAAKILSTPPKDPKQDYQPTEPVKGPEPVHDRVLTTRV
jgi:ATP-dependent Lon protease